VQLHLDDGAIDCARVHRCCNDNAVQPCTGADQKRHLEVLIRVIVIVHPRPYDHAAHARLERRDRLGEKARARMHGAAPAAPFVRFALGCQGYERCRGECNRPRNDRDAVEELPAGRIMRRVRARAPAFCARTYTHDASLVA